MHCLQNCDEQEDVVDVSISAINSKSVKMYIDKYAMQHMQPKYVIEELAPRMCVCTPLFVVKFQSYNSTISPSSTRSTSSRRRHSWTSYVGTVKIITALRKNPIRFSAQLGGWTGLAIGASAFSFIEIVYFLGKLAKIFLTTYGVNRQNGQKRGENKLKKKVRFLYTRNGIEP